MSDGIGMTLASVGVLLLFSVLAYGFYQMTRYIKMGADYDEKYWTLKEVLIGKIASRKGINLEHEIEKGKVMQSKSFRKRIEEATYEELFGKESKK